MLLSAWWGLTRPLKRRADALSLEGFVVLAPDLAFGVRPETEEAAEPALAEADPNRLAFLVMTSADLLAEKSEDGPIGVIGYGMGGSLGLWLSVRRPDLVAAAVSVAHRRGMDVPRDISVVGFDDTPTATTVWPELTTIRQPIAAMAASSIDLLLRSIRRRKDGEARVVVDHVVAHMLVKRDSVAAPNPG